MGDPGARTCCANKAPACCGDRDDSEALRAKCHEIGAGERFMENSVYKVVELVGVSPDSLEDAIASAIKRAGETLRHMQWFEVTQIRGRIDKGNVQKFQVTLKVGFAQDREQD
jgi:flavin-binding protein dodecin